MAKGTMSSAQGVILVGKHFTKPTALPKGQPRRAWGPTFLLLFGLLLGLHGCVILGHVDNIDVVPVANGLQQAEESHSYVPSEEGLEAIKHHSLEAVTQLKPQ